MHRSTHDGLRRDEYGETLDPDERRRRLQRLGGFLGNDADGARFNAALAYALDPVELERERKRRHVYLGRYMHLSVTNLSDVEVTTLRAYIDLLSDLLRAEHPISSITETDR